MFYVIELIEFETDPTSKAIYEYESYDAALSRYHKDLGGWIGKDGVNTVSCRVTDINNNDFVKECWRK